MSAVVIAVAAAIEGRAGKAAAPPAVPASQAAAATAVEGDGGVGSGDGGGGGKAAAPPAAARTCLHRHRGLRAGVGPGDSVGPAAVAVGRVGAAVALPVGRLWGCYRGS